MKYIQLPNDRVQETKLVGGKGKNLSILSSSNIPVPKGFIVNTIAYQDFLSCHNIEKIVATRFSHIDIENTYELETLLIEIRQTIVASSIPGIIQKEIRNGYELLRKELKKEKLIMVVRSSATSEDLAEGSYAGQYDTFLNIRSLEDILTALKECWTSLWGERAVKYRIKQGLKHDDVSMAVVVQEMIFPDTSGILFTSDFRNKDTIIINSSWGLGEPIVSGNVNPDIIEIDKHSFQITSQSIGDKAKTLIAVPHQEELLLSDTPEDKRNILSLNREQIRLLTKTALEIEHIYDTPQDIEWAFSDKKLYILQTRPITTLHQEDGQQRHRTPASSDIPEGYWTRLFFNEWFNQPLSPLFRTLQFPGLIENSVKIFLDKFHMSIQTPSFIVINGYPYIRGNLRVSLKFVFFPFSFIIACRNIYQAEREWKNTIVPNHEALLARYNNTDYKELKTVELWACIIKICEINEHYFGWNIYTGSICIGAEILLDWMYQLLVKREKFSYVTLLQGFSNKSTEADKKLGELTNIVKKSPYLKEVFSQTHLFKILPELERSEEGQQFIKLFQKFISNYGHRVFDLDFVYPTPAEDISSLLATIKEYISSHVQLDDSIELHLVEKREKQLEDDLLSLKGKPIRRGLFRKVLQFAQRYAQIRESRPFYLHMGWPLVRKALLELGRRIVNSDVCDYPNDIFFLTKNEIEEFVVGKQKTYLGEVIKNRKKEREQQKKNVPVLNLTHPTFIGEVLTKFNTTQTFTESENVLAGFPGSPGQVRGTARVIISPDDFGRLRRGDILIAPATTPAWTSLFAMISGLVTDIGGPLSHGAIISREYGIPAVLGVRQATQKIKDGQEITVNGSEGQVLY